MANENDFRYLEKELKGTKKIISEDELILRMKILDLYCKVYKLEPFELPRSLFKFSLEELKKDITTCHKRLYFLQFSVSYNYEEIIHIFLEPSFVLKENEKESLEQTWYNALEYNNIKAMQVLKKIGINPPDDLLLTDSMWGISNFNTLKYLVKVLKQDVNQTGYLLRETSIMKWARYGKKQEVIYLHENGAVIDHKNVNGDTCIDYLMRLFDFEFYLSFSKEIENKINEIIELFCYLVENGCPCTESQKDFLQDLQKYQLSKKG